MTKAGRRVPMTSERRLKGVLALKKLLPKRAKHLLMSAVSIFNMRMITLSLELPHDPLRIFLAIFVAEHCYPAFLLFYFVAGV